MIRWSIIVFVSLMTGWIIYCSRPNNGIIPVGKDAVLLTGECVVINWDASVITANDTIAQWRAMRGI